MSPSSGNGGEKLKKIGLLVATMLLLAFTVAAVPTVAEQSWEVNPTDYSQEILNDTEQDELIDLVVFAFTIGIIMTILGFAMGIMFQRRGR